jgi:hypothetical protein
MATSLAGQWTIVQETSPVAAPALAESSNENSEIDTRWPQQRRIDTSNLTTGLQDGPKGRRR